MCQTTSGRSNSLARVFFVYGACLVLIGIAAPGNAAFASELPNLITRENAKPGTTDWQFYWSTLDQSRLTNGTPAIEGYASLTSVPRGGTVELFVNTPEPSYTIEVFRLGWYGGQGGRLMAGPVQRTGVKQIIPLPPNDGIRLVDCNWTDPYRITIPTNSPDADGWVSGVYWVKLTSGTTHRNSFIEFVVRDDDRPSTYLMERACTTSQAYNEWGGVSLYSSMDTNGPAHAVSFNRPYLPIDNPLVEWELPMLHFLEREGFDVTYCSSLDLHESPGMLLKSRVFLSVGHDEYWSWAMRQNVENARDQGVSLAFFSANVCYWQVRFQPSNLTAAADRTMVCYKSATLDPYATDGDPSNAPFITTLWRQNPVKPPEDALVGILFRYLVNTNMVIFNATHWICAGAGLTNGSVLPSLVGDEGDTLGTAAPTGTTLITHSPCIENGLPPGFADSSVYTAMSGADVFAAGTEQWSWGLDGVHSQPAAQQMTRNILTRLSRCVPIQQAMVSWWRADGDGTDELGRNPGSFPNGVSFGTGASGLGFNFNGANQYFVATNVATSNMSQSQLSLDTWVKPAVPPNANGLLFAASADGVSPWCTVVLDQQGILKVELAETNNTGLVRTAYLSSEPVLTFGQFQHLAITADTQAQAVKVYINGSAVSLNAQSGSLLMGGGFPPLQYLYLGGFPASALAQYYRGLIDEVGLYARVLRSDEVLAICRQGSGGRCGDVPNLIWTASGERNVLSWPLGAPGFNLESSPDLHTWNLETNVTTFNGDQFQFSPPSSSLRGYFRLRRKF